MLLQNIFVFYLLEGRFFFLQLFHNLGQVLRIYKMGVLFCNKSFTNDTNLKMSIFLSNQHIVHGVKKDLCR